MREVYLVNCSQANSSLINPKVDRNSAPLSRDSAQCKMHIALPGRTHGSCFIFTTWGRGTVPVTFFDCANTADYVAMKNIKNTLLNDDLKISL